MMPMLSLCLTVRKQLRRARKKEKKQQPKHDFNKGSGTQRCSKSAKSQSPIYSLSIYDETTVGNVF